MLVQRYVKTEKISSINKNWKKRGCLIVIALRKLSIHIFKKKILFMYPGVYKSLPEILEAFEA